MRKSLSGALSCATALALFAAVLAYAPAAQDGARNGLALALHMALPSLFPFFLVSGLLSGSGMTTDLGRACARPLKRLYGLPGCAAGPLLLGLTGGYPIGAASAADLYRSGMLTRPQAERLLGFCNNTGPAFMIGVCGVGILGSVKSGLWLYAIHALSALLVGLVLCPHRLPCSDDPAAAASAPAPESFSALFVRVIGNSLSSCLTVSAFIIAFSVIRSVCAAVGLLAAAAKLLLPLCLLLGLPAATVYPLTAGALELTSGLALLGEIHLPPTLLLPVLSALTAFGGLSVWMQSMSVCAGTDLRLRRCFAGKALHAVFAAALTAALCRLFPTVLPVFGGQPLPAVRPLPLVLLTGFIILLTFSYSKLRQNKV